MKLCKQNELSEEAKKQALEKYGNEKIEEWILENDSWFDENGFIAVYLKKRRTKMRLVLWCELSEEVKRKALKMYGEDRIEEYDCMDALFDDEEGYCVEGELV